LPPAWSIVDQPFGSSTGRLADVPWCAGMTGVVGDAVGRALDHRDFPPSPRYRWAVSHIVGSVNTPVQFAVEHVDQDELALACTFAARRPVVAAWIVIAITLEFTSARAAEQGFIAPVYHVNGSTAMSLR
jgi:hypothetical protein